MAAPVRKNRNRICTDDSYLKKTTVESESPTLCLSPITPVTNKETVSWSSSDGSSYYSSEDEVVDLDESSMLQQRQQRREEKTCVNKASKGSEVTAVMIDDQIAAGERSPTGTGDRDGTENFSKNVKEIVKTIEDNMINNNNAIVDAIMDIMSGDHDHYGYDDEGYTSINDNKNKHESENKSGDDGDEVSINDKKLFQDEDEEKGGTVIWEIGRAHV